MSNATCFSKHAPLKEPPLIQNGQLRLQAHHVGWMVATFFTLVATVVSFWLIIQHLTWYTEKRQQRYIVRLLFMVPIYATVSLASYIFWNDAISITLARDSYEAFVLYCFFYLLLQYLSPTTEGQKEVFRHVAIEKWVIPLGFVKYRPEDGLYFLQLMKWGVLQYCVVRPTTTLAAVILDAVGLYCNDSWSPGWGHVYITVLVSVSVSIAMYCLIQLYVPISRKLAPYKPLLKLFSVKAVVFLTFWQATGLSLLAVFGVVKGNNYMTAEDVNTGIAALLETFEMMCFAFLHIYAFSYIPYREGKNMSDRTSRFRSLMHVLDIRDMWREFRESSVYMGKTMLGVEAEEDARKRIHFAMVMGRERATSVTEEPMHDWVAEELGEEDMLLDSPRHGKGHGTRQMWLSDPTDRFGGAFQDEVETELRRRELDNYGRFGLDEENPHQGHKRGQSSWWKGVYDRLFQSRASEDRLSPVPRKSSHIRRPRQGHRDGSQFPSLDSPPPLPSVLYEYAPGQGRSNIRLSNSQRPANDTWESQEREGTSLQHRYVHHHKPSITSPRHGTYAYESSSDDRVFTKAIAAPRPVSASQKGDVALVVSKEDSPFTVTESLSIPRHDSVLAAPSGVLRSDSLLARVFPNSTADTFDGHVSSENKTNLTPSQDTHRTALMFPQAMPSSPVGIISPIRGRRAEPFLMPDLSSPDGLRSPAHEPTSASRDVEPQPPLHSPRRGPPRPDVVLPAPLSPARYPVEPRHGYPPPQNVSYYPPPTDSTMLSQPLSLTPHSSNYVSPRPRYSDKHRSNRRHSAQIERPLARQQRAAKRKSVPEINDAVSPDTPSPMAFRAEIAHPLQDGGVSTNRRNMTDLPRLPDSPTDKGSVSHPTASPSASPARILRHAGDDISKARRPWS